MTSDPIADMLTRVRNAIQARHPKVDVPASRLKAEIAAELADVPPSLEEITEGVAIPEGGGDEAAIKEAAKKAGYDGAILTERDTKGNPATSYVAFDKSQVKSAFEPSIFSPGSKLRENSENPALTQSALETAQPGHAMPGK